MLWKPILWRTARRVEDAYRRARGRAPPLDAPWYAWQKLTGTLRLAAHAQRRGWRRAGREQCAQLDRDLDHLLAELRALREPAQRRRSTAVPSAGELYAELLAADDDFGGVGVDDFELFVTTEPIRLEDIYLGPFEIRLNLSRLDQPEPYRIVALEPHPAQSSSDTTHPHVHHEKICLGEGKGAVAAALVEGRLADLFQLIHRVLQTYGEGSAYVELARWYGTPCAECDDHVEDDRLHSCRGCDSSLCDDCVRFCQCGSAACHDCATYCFACEEVVCSRCLTTCGGCEEEFCASCLEEGLCHACQEATEEERRESERDVEFDDQPEPEVYRSGVVETAVLARPGYYRNRRLRNLGRR